MAWIWTSVKKNKDGSFVITATENEEIISINVNAERATAEEMIEHLANVLQQKVTEINSIETEEANKLSWLQANIDILGVS